MKNKFGFIQAVVVGLIGLVVVFGVGAYAAFKNKHEGSVAVQNQMSTSQVVTTNNTNAQTEPMPSKDDWLTYSDSTFGFQFQYPAQINGINTKVVPLWSKDGMSIMAGDVAISFRPNKFSNYMFPPKSSKDGQDHSLKFGLASDGGMGGYIYDPNEGLWRVNNFVTGSGFDYSKKVTWDDFYKARVALSPADFPSFKIDNSHWALSRRAEAFESFWSEYYLFYPDKDIFVSFAYFYSYCGVLPNGGMDCSTHKEKSVVDVKTREIEKILTSIVKTFKVI